MNYSNKNGTLKEKMMGGKGSWAPEVVVQKSPRGPNFAGNPAKS